MNQKEFIKDIIADFHSGSLNEVKSRDINVPVNSKKIISLLGARRCGKTYLMLDTINKMTGEKINRNQILYLNFEDERFNFEVEGTDIILQSYLELYPELDLSRCYFFFDEIQNVPGWEKFIRRVYDSVTKNIFVTGSNSHFLSSDIATSLRGRTVRIEVYPLSFAEYLNFKGVSTSIYGKKAKAILKNIFFEYLQNGGYPETVDMSGELREKTLQEYYQVLLYKDLIERYNISNTQILTYFLKRLVANLSSVCSINKIYNEIKSQGYKVPKNLLYDLFDWTESVYFSFKVSKYSKSVIKQNSLDKKVYIIDNGMVNALSYSFANDYGKLLENAIFLHLCRQHGNNIYFYKNGKECDFVTFDKDKVNEIIQVCYDLSDIETYNREINGLLDACKYFGKKEGMIITIDVEKEIKYENLNIKIIPAFKYLLIGG